MGGSGREELNRQPPPSPAVLWIVNVRERKLRKEKKMEWLNWLKILILINKYKYSGYCIGFDACWSFSLSNVTGFRKNVIIFGADMNSLVHIKNKKKISWFLVKQMV